MKRMCLLLGLLLLLSGCAEGPQTDPVTTGTPGTSGTEVLGETIPETIDYHQTVLDMMATLPEIKPYDGEIRVPYDPDRKVYISLTNQDCDFYPDCDFNYNFGIITLEPYDVSQIQASFDMQTEYAVTVLDYTDFAGGFGYDDYQMYSKQDLYADAMRARYSHCGYLLKDQYYDMRRAVMAAANAAGKRAQDTPEYQLLEKHINGYQEQIDACKAPDNKLKQEFQAIPKDNLPSFYVYNMCVEFTGLGSYEETVETATFTIGDTEYPVSFGQWRLHKETPQEIMEGFTSPGLRGAGSVTSTFAREVGPYTDGYVSAIHYSFDVDEDLTLLGIRQMETAVEAFSVKGAKVELYKIKDGERVLVMDYLWDTHQPLNLAAGDIVEIHFCIQDGRLMEEDYGISPVFFLDYELRNREYSLVAFGHMKRCNSITTFASYSYLLHFEGIDIGEYLYYHRSSSWLDELPEEWLK